MFVRRFSDASRLLLIGLFLWLSAVLRPAYADDGRFIEDWPGTYHGRNDGRPATLTIEKIRETGGAAFYRLRLEDRDRGVVFTGEEKVRKNDKSHRMKNVKLRSPEGPEKNIKWLFLHTWNTDVISGFNKWRGVKYGMAFSRDRFMADAGAGPRYGDDPSRHCHWTGIYDGWNDGRRARLTISTDDWEDSATFGIRGIRYNVVLEDLERGHVFSGEARLNFGKPHIMKGMTLRAEDGTTKKIRRLFLHSWDVNYISGFSKWSGKRYGLAFKRSSDRILAGCQVASSHDGKIGEVARVTTSHSTRSVRYPMRYNDPVIVAGPPGFNGRQPALVRITEIDRDRFTIRLQEWDYLDGPHAREPLNALILEAGEHRLEDGHRLKAGYIDGMTDEWVDVSFATPFEGKPVVIAQVASMNGTDAVTPRLRNVSRTGFSIRLQEQESKGAHPAAEKVAIIAAGKGLARIGGMPLFFAGETPTPVRHDWYRISSGDWTALLAQMQTYRGNNPSSLRRRPHSDSRSGIDVFVQEERSADAETAHSNAEDVGYILARPGPIRISDTEPDDDETSPSSSDSTWTVTCACVNARDDAAETTIRTCAAPPEVDAHFRGLDLQCNLLAETFERRTGASTRCSAVNGTQELEDRSRCPSPSAGFFEILCEGRC